MYQTFRPLLDALKRRGADSDAVEEAGQEAERSGRSIRDVLINDRIVTEQELTEASAEAYGVASVDIVGYPIESNMRVRDRIDGVMHEVDIVPKGVQAAVISRLKIMSGVDITERRVPQNGRITINLGHRKVDFRTATLPTVWGEKVVLRVLDTSGIDLELQKLGFTDHHYGPYSASLAQPHGMILAAGPTRSG